MGIPRIGRRRSDRRARAGFTLVEVLVVVGVIAVLVGILLPALSKAKQATRLAVSMSNVRQITAAGVIYSLDQRDGMWPLVPAKVYPATVALDSWTFGGKTGGEYWERFDLHHPIATRPLNRYLYPDLPLRDRPDERLELRIYQCPADNVSYQRHWPGYTPTISSYDDVGTSYHLNLRWWWAARIENWSSPGRSFANDAELWKHTSKWFRLSFNKAPARFVWLYDQVMDVVAIAGEERLGFHGGVNRSVTAFMDGHASYTEVVPKSIEGPGYTLKLGELYRGANRTHR